MASVKRCADHWQVISSPEDNQILNQLFTPKNDLDRDLQRAIDQDDELERRCRRCQDTGLWNREEVSQLNPQGKVLMWYRCDCRAGRVPKA